MKSYYYSKNYIDKNDVELVSKLLRNNSIMSNGKYLEELETKFKKIFKSKYALAVSSGTAALHLSYIGLGLKRGDYIITTPLTWVSTVNAALYCGAKVKLIDIDFDTLNIDLFKLEEFLNKVKKAKIIVPVHFAGLPIDLKKLKKIAKEHKCLIVEDAAQALGAKYENALVGNSKYSDATIFSLHPSKTITAGEGGVILTNNRNLYLKARQLKHSGTKISKKKSWYAEATKLGFNYKIPEMSCALAISQLKKFDKFVQKRKYLY